MAAVLSVAGEFSLLVFVMGTMVVALVVIIIVIHSHGVSRRRVGKHIHHAITGDKNQHEE